MLGAGVALLALWVLLGEVELLGTGILILTAAVGSVLTTAAYPSAVCLVAVHLPGRARTW